MLREAAAVPCSAERSRGRALASAMRDVIRSTSAADVAACVAMLTAGLEAAGYAVTDGGI